MKKIAKLSLVAAVAVAGLSSTASAAALEEAIKNTSISGQFRYRLHDTNTGTNSTDVEIEMGVKSKVTDNVTAVFKFDTAQDNDTSSVTEDAIDIEDYYLSYSNNGTTVNLGQQNIPTRQVFGKQGDGIVALQKVGGATVGAAYFMNNTITSVNDADDSTTTSAAGYDVASVLVTGNIGGVSGLIQASEVVGLADALNVKLDTAISGVKLGAEYSEVELDSDGSQELETTKISASGKIGSVALAATYVTTGKAGSGSIDVNAESASELTGFQVHSAGRFDFDYFVVKATLPVAAKTSFTAYYGDGDEVTAENGSTKQDVSEYFGQVTYAAAKNLNAYVRYGTKDIAGTDTDKLRVEVKYSF